jgi:DNA-binding beta-propeller fold protein YncE
MKIRQLGAFFFAVFAFIFAFGSANQEAQELRKTAQLPTSKILMLPVPGRAHGTNSFPTAAAVSPDGKCLAILNNGYGTAESERRQSIAVLDLATNTVTDFPDPRLGHRARQTYFLGLAFSVDGSKLYASMGSMSDPTGARPGDTGNGIAVYNFKNGRVSPESFLKIPLAPLGRGKEPSKASDALPHGTALPFPAGIAVVGGGVPKLLVAENLADDAILMDTENGRILHRFPLSDSPVVPAAYPFGVVATRDGKKGYCSLWNASAIAELNLARGRVTRRISLDSPKSPIAAGSHPTAMLLSRDEKVLYVTLTNSDRVAVVNTATGQVEGVLSTELPGQEYGGSSPMALALSGDGERLFVADASANAVAVFNTSAPLGTADAPARAMGFIPTDWYPTALAAQGGDLFIITGKGEGTGPNSALVEGPGGNGRRHPYIATLLHGSVARLSIQDAESNLPALTREVEESNLMAGSPGEIRFARGSNPIHHIIYIIKENRTYDQIFGDIAEANGDPALVMYGERITPNQHALARQFGILDNFYCSGEVSGDGHVWSTAAITSDYNEKTWQIAYRGDERTYDYEGEVMHGFPLEQGVPDVDEPGTGYIWANVARHQLTYRNYGEFVATHWCDQAPQKTSPQLGSPLPAGESCPKAFVRRGEPLPPNVGQPHGSRSPWPWPVPMIARDQATKPELEGHYDSRFADFRLDYPDQLRVDEFLNEFGGYVKAREKGSGTELPQFVILRLPNDHTAGTAPGMPTPSASVADNDLAVGRVVEAVSHSPYWDDTAILILEDDAQDGADHVDAHRSTALVISKYSPGSPDHPFVDHNFYTTVNMIHTMEELLGLPPMNNNDARAPVMAAPFSGPGDQPPFSADKRILENGLLYRTNPPGNPGAAASLRMDFSHADAANAHELNAILWRDRKGNAPMPKPRHTVIREGHGDGD